jgi:hypothetical protein
MHTQGALSGVYTECCRWARKDPIFFYRTDIDEGGCFEQGVVYSSSDRP